jgi:anti-anti-sigma regulatory factor
VGVIQISRTSTAVVVSVPSDFDQKAAMDLYDILFDLIIVQGSRAIVVDLASHAAGALGSAVLAGAKAMAIERDCHLMFRSRSPAVSAVLQSPTPIVPP